MSRVFGSCWLAVRLRDAVVSEGNFCFFFLRILVCWMLVSAWLRPDCLSPMSWSSSLKGSCVVVVVICFLFMLVLSLHARCPPHWLSLLIPSISCFEHTMVVQLQRHEALKNARSPVSFDRCLISSFRRWYFCDTGSTLLKKKNLSNLRFDMFLV